MTIVRVGASMHSNSEAQPVTDVNLLASHNRFHLQLKHSRHIAMGGGPKNIRWALVALTSVGGCAHSLPQWWREVAARPRTSYDAHQVSLHENATPIVRDAQSVHTPSGVTTVASVIPASAIVESAEPFLQEPADLAPSDSDKPLQGTSQAIDDLVRPTMPVDFETVIALTSAQNTEVALAQARIRQAYAQLTSAKALWLPSLRVGMNYNKHEGRIQDVAGQAIETSRGAAYAGLGASAVGASSPAIPGVSMNFHLADAIHQPRIAGYALQAKRSMSRAVLNEQQLAASLAYLQLLRASQERAIAVETLAHVEELNKQTSAFVSAGNANQLDLDRSAVSMMTAKNQLSRSQESVQVASIQLAQILSINPTLELIPQETTFIPLELIEVDLVPNDLVATGLAQRPELQAHRALVCEAINRLRREQHAPWMPSVILGMSQGGFGAGLGSDITNSGDRFDFDGIAYWEVRNLGFGESAARRNASSLVSQARIQEVSALNKVACEVMGAYAKVTSRRERIQSSEQSVAAAYHAYQNQLDRLKNNLGTFQEVAPALQTWDSARREYLRAIAEYNEAQFELQHALGWPT